MSTQKPPLLADATRDLARFGAALQYANIPADVIARIKLSLLDSLGCCLFGATLPWTQKVAELADAEAAKPAATLIGLGRKTSPALAALVNGTSGHAFELDDIHKESIVHAGSIATPVALGLGETRGKTSGRDVLTAMVAGYEIGHRVGNAATMSLFFRGFHPQGTSGAFVAVATAARMLGLGAAQFQHALGMAGSQAGGLMAAQEGAMVKRFHSGRAAQNGVYAAQLASRDFTGILDALEAPYGGYLSTYSDRPDPARLTAGLGKTWETLNVGYKPHASVTSIHSALDGLAAVMQEQRLKADEIVRVEAGLSPMTHVHCAWAYKAQGVTAAQVNLYYGMAVIALDGAAFTEQFREARLSDPRILYFITRISAHVDPEIEKMGAPFRHASRVKITTRNGKVFEKLSLHRRGSPENPLSPDEVVHKFRNVVAPCMDNAAAERIIAAVDRFETLADINELMPLLGAAVRTIRKSIRLGFRRAEPTRREQVRKRSHSANNRPYVHAGFRLPKGKPLSARVVSRISAQLPSNLAQRSEQGKCIPVAWLSRWGLFCASRKFIRRLLDRRRQSDTSSGQSLLRALAPRTVRVPTHVAHQVLVAVGDVFAKQRQPLGAWHDLEVALQAGVHLGAVDHHAGGSVVGHLLQGHRRAQHVACERLAALDIFGPHAQATRGALQRV